jgi:hypothetical protein
MSLPTLLPPDLQPLPASDSLNSLNTLTRIDSLKNASPDNLNGYDKRSANDVLAVIVRCKYSVEAKGRSVAETFDFYLSPDGSKCYAKTKAK